VTARHNRRINTPRRRRRKITGIGTTASQPEAERRWQL